MSLFRSPLWLFGWVALAGAFLFQALALHDGLVSVVQPLLVTELVFALVLRRFWIHQSIRWITWVAVLSTCAGLAGCRAGGEPRWLIRPRRELVLDRGRGGLRCLRGSPGPLLRSGDPPGLRARLYPAGSW